MTFEIRGGIPAKIRADADGIKVEGYAAVFNQEVDIGGMFREVIERGAFTDAIGRDDVVFLINHDGLPLARSMATTPEGRLTLEQDSHGLKISAMLDPNDPDVQRISGKMERGILNKMSFAFYPEVQEWDEEGDTPLRTIKQARLADVSIVTTPAYDGTEIALRSLAASRPGPPKRDLRKELNSARLSLAARVYE